MLAVTCVFTGKCKENRHCPKFLVLKCIAQERTFPVIQLLTTGRILFGLGYSAIWVERAGGRTRAEHFVVVNSVDWYLH